MSQLETFRDHCRAMAATDAHLPGCESLLPSRRARPIWEPTEDGHGLAWLGTEPAWTPPKCDGCVPEADRALFARMSAEIDDYLTTDADEGLFA